MDGKAGRSSLNLLVCPVSAYRANTLFIAIVFILYICKLKMSLCQVKKSLEKTGRSPQPARQGGERKKMSHNSQYLQVNASKVALPSSPKSGTFLRWQPQTEHLCLSFIYLSHLEQIFNRRSTSFPSHLIRPVSL